MPPRRRRLPTPRPSVMTPAVRWPDGLPHRLARCASCTHTATQGGSDWWLPRRHRRPPGTRRRVPAGRQSPLPASPHWRCPGRRPRASAGAHPPPLSGPDAARSADGLPPRGLRPDRALVRPQRARNAEPPPRRRQVPRGAPASPPRRRLTQPGRARSGGAVPAPMEQTTRTRRPRAPARGGN